MTHPASAALVPGSLPAASNLNTHSVRPVELRRDPDFTLPDISEIFHGYTVDELPDDIAIPTASSPDAPSDNDDILILELSVGKAILNDSLIAYSTQNSVLLPLGLLSEAFDLSIQSDAQAGQAEGWVLQQDQTFKLDAKRRIVTLQGQVESIDSNQIVLKEDDIYVDMQLLAKWLKIDFDFSFAQQTLSARGKDGSLLPIEKYARIQLARKDLRLKPTDPSTSYPIIRAPYTSASLPFSDLTITHDYDQQSTPTSRSQGSILSHGDLLYMNQRSFVSYNKETGLQDVRLTLSRKDPEGELFYGDDPISTSWLAKQANRAELTSLEIGDVYTDQLPLTMLNQDGRGVVVTNQPLNRADQYDRTSISGDVQPNWEVELYRNEELLAFQRSSSTGRYEFNDVPLLSGLNLFRLVFYGPFGETREEVKRILVNQDITKKGAAYFRFMAMEQGQNLVGGGNSQAVNFSSSLFSGNNHATSLNTRGKERAALELEYGLDDQLALYLQAAHIPISRDLETNAATIGLAGVWQDIYGRMDISRSDDGGNALQLITQTNLWDINLSLRHQQFDDYLSDYTEDVNDPVRMRTIIRADSFIDLPVLPRLSVGLAAAHTEFDSGRTRDEINQRTTTTLFGRASLNHNITFSRDDTPGSPSGPSESTRGNVLVSIPAFGAYLRGGANYGITPDTRLETVSLTADYSINPDTLVRGEIYRQFSPHKDTFQASLTHQFTHFALGLSGGITSDGEALAGLSFNTAFGFEPRSGQFRSYANPVSRQGLISAQSYIDHNQNDIKDAGEPTIDAVGYLVNSGAGSRRSYDKIQGSQLLKYVSPNELIPVTINPSTLENPFLVAGDSSVRVIARPGTPMLLDFALQPAADVEGQVWVQMDGEQREASNVLIEALNEHGKIIRSTRTAFDGIYLMELLPQGNYTLRISPEQLEKRGFNADAQKNIQIDGKQDYIQGIDFMINKE